MHAQPTNKECAHGNEDPPLSEWSTSGHQSRTCEEVASSTPLKGTAADAAAADAGLKQVAKNCGALATRYNAEGPPREIMPQFDPKRGGPDFKKVKDEFETGELNFNPGFKRKAVAGATGRRAPGGRMRLEKKVK